MILKEKNLLNLKQDRNNKIFGKLQKVGKILIELEKIKNGDL